MFSVSPLRSTSRPALFYWLVAYTITAWRGKSSRYISTSCKLSKALDRCSVFGSWGWSRLVSTKAMANISAYKRCCGRSGSSIGIVTRLTAGRAMVRFPLEGKAFLLSTRSRPVLWSNQSSLWRAPEGSFPGVQTARTRSWLQVYLLLTFRMGGAVRLLLLHNFMESTGPTLRLPFDSRYR